MRRTTSAPQVNQGGPTGNSTQTPEQAEGSKGTATSIFRKLGSSTGLTSLRSKTNLTGLRELADSTGLTRLRSRTKLSSLKDVFARRRPDSPDSDSDREFLSVDAKLAEQRRTAEALGLQNATGSLLRQEGTTPGPAGSNTGDNQAGGSESPFAGRGTTGQSVARGSVSTSASAEALMMVDRGPSAQDGKGKGVEGSTADNVIDTVFSPADEAYYRRDGRSSPPDSPRPLLARGSLGSGSSSVYSQREDQGPEQTTEQTYGPVEDVYAEFLVPPARESSPAAGGSSAAASFVSGDSAESGLAPPNPRRRPVVISQGTRLLTGLGLTTGASSSGGSRVPSAGSGQTTSSAVQVRDAAQALRDAVRADPGREGVRDLVARYENLTSRAVSELSLGLTSQLALSLAGDLFAAEGAPLLSSPEGSSLDERRTRRLSLADQLITVGLGSPRLRDEGRLGALSSRSSAQGVADASLTRLGEQLDGTLQYALSGQYAGEPAGADLQRTVSEGVQKVLPPLPPGPRDDLAKKAKYEELEGQIAQLEAQRAGLAPDSDDFRRLTRALDAFREASSELFPEFRPVVPSKPQP